MIAGRPPLDPEELQSVVAATKDQWRAVDGSRFFVTGGTGFIGTWLVESFLAAKRELGLATSAVVLTRNPAAFRLRSPHLAADPAVTLLEGDVRSFQAPPGPFDFVVHGATEASAVLNEERPGEMFDSIVSGTRRTLEFARSSGARRFLLLSSGAVYGPQPPDLDRVAEDYRGGPDPLSPRSAYGEGKRAAELLTAIPSDAPLEAVVARCFAFVGPHLPFDRHFAIGNFIGDALAGRPIEVKGDGTPLRSYLYAADLAVWLWTLLFRGRPLRPYNVGSEVAVSVGEAARRVAAVRGGTEVRIARTPDGGRLPERYVPSTARARNELGVRETVGLDEAIRLTMKWANRGRGGGR